MYTDHPADRTVEEKDYIERRIWWLNWRKRR